MDMAGFLTDYAKPIGILMTVATTILLLVNKKYNLSKFQRLTANHAAIDLISKLDTEYVNYIGSRTPDNPKLKRKDLEGRKNEIRHLKQILYANLVGYTLRLNEIERIQKSSNPIYSMRLYSQYNACFKDDENGPIVFKDKPKSFGWRIFSFAIFSLAVSLYPLSSFGVGNSIIANVYFAIIFAALYPSGLWALFKGLDYITVDTKNLKKHVVDIS